MVSERPEDDMLISLFSVSTTNRWEFYSILKGLKVRVAWLRS